MANPAQDIRMFFTKGERTTPFGIPTDSILVAAIAGAKTAIRNREFDRIYTINYDYAVLKQNSSIQREALRHFKSINERPVKMTAVTFSPAVLRAYVADNKKSMFDNAIFTFEAKDEKEVHTFMRRFAAMVAAGVDLPAHIHRAKLQDNIQVMTEKTASLEELRAEWNRKPGSRDAISTEDLSVFTSL